MSPTRALAVSIALALATADCALLQKSKPVPITYYTPEQSGLGIASRQAADGRTFLGLGRVAAGSDLGERIAFGDGQYQLHYYDERRWTLHPEVYVERSLAHTLFEERGFRRATDGNAPTLDVEVLAFQEVKTPERHEARVALGLVLSTDHVLLEDRVTVSHPVAGDSFEAFVAAMALALHESSDEVASRVGSALGAAAGPSERDLPSRH